MIILILLFKIYSWEESKTQLFYGFGVKPLAEDVSEEKATKTSLNQRFNILLSLHVLTKGLGDFNYGLCSEVTFDDSVRSVH